MHDKQHAQGSCRLLLHNSQRDSVNINFSYIGLLPLSHSKCKHGFAVKQEGLQNAFKRLHPAECLQK